MGKPDKRLRHAKLSKTSSSSSFPFPALALSPVFAFAFISVFAFCSAGVDAANLSIEQQLDVLSGKIASAENAVFNETGGSSSAIVFDKQGSGPYHNIFRYIAVYSPNNKPWNEIFEVNTERTLPDWNKNGVFNGFSVSMALPWFICQDCYRGDSSSDKLKALFYWTKTPATQYPRYTVYWEGNSFTPDYEAVLNALTRACLDAQTEIARFEAQAASPSPLPFPSPKPSAKPSVKPSVAPSPVPSIDFIAGAANESNETNDTNETGATGSSNEPVDSLNRPASETGLVAAGAVSEDEQWMTYSALLLVVGCAGIVAFYSRGSFLPQAKRKK